MRWLGGRCLLISKVEEVKMLEPDMPLQRPKSSWVDCSNPETPVSKHRQSETLLSHQERSWAVPGVACSRNVYQAVRVEVIKEHMKANSTNSWLHFEIFESKTQNTSSVVSCFIMDFCMVQFSPCFEDLSFTRHSVKELIHWHLFSTDVTSWPTADHVHSSLSKSDPVIERRPISVCSRAHFTSGHILTWQFM